MTSDTAVADPGPRGLQRRRPARRPLASPGDRRPLRLVHERDQRVGGLVPHPRGSRTPAGRSGGVNDLNDDDKADLLWHHQATGELYVWYMNGIRCPGARTSPRPASPTPAGRSSRALPRAPARFRRLNRPAEWKPPGPVNLRRAALRRAGQGGYRVATLRLRCDPGCFAGATGREAACGGLCAFAGVEAVFVEARHRQQVRGIPCRLLREWMLHPQWRHRVPQVHGEPAASSEGVRSGSPRDPA